MNNLSNGFLLYVSGLISALLLWITALLVFNIMFGPIAELCLTIHMTPLDIAFKEGPMVQVLGIYFLYWVIGTVGVFGVLRLYWGFSRR